MVDNTVQSSDQVYATRRSQLRRLIAMRTGGNASAFAKEMGYSRAQISQFMSATYNDGRSIGERAARAIEDVASVPFGWLDQSTATAPDLPTAPDSPIDLILAELRKQTTLLEVIAKQGDRQLDCIAGARPLRVTLASAADAHGLPG